jgi:hypothetical protein
MGVMKRAGIAAGLGAAALAFTGPARRWMRNQGARPEEIEGALPGDDILAGDVDQATRAVTIDAPAAAIWPWLAQMGDGRGGFYGGEALFRIFGLQHGKSAERVVPAMQELREGDALPAGWTEFTVRKVEPNRALVLSRAGRGYEYTWALVLQPEASGTRLLSRTRYVGSRATLAVAEPILYAMLTRWFQSVKERAERTARTGATPPPPERTTVP